MFDFFSTKKHKSLEDTMPLLKIENDALVSKYADITIGFKVDLLEVYSVDDEGFNEMHTIFNRAIGLLPKYSIVHKQDWYMKDTYKADAKEGASILTSAYENHFDGRVFLDHTCYLYISKISRWRSKNKTIHHTLTSNKLVPAEMLSASEMNDFFDRVNQFVRVLEDSGLVRITRLLEDDYVDKNDNGIIPDYFNLKNPDHILNDVDFKNGLQIGNNIADAFILSDLENLPDKVSNAKKFSKYSTDKTDFYVSWTFPVGLELFCNHIYNQYIFIDDKDQIVAEFQQKQNHFNSMSLKSHNNRDGRDKISRFLQAINDNSSLPVRCHFNLFFWSDKADEAETIRSRASSAITQMNYRSYRNSLDVGRTYWGGIPGNAGDISWEDTFYSLLEPATCLLALETNYIPSQSKFGIKLSDRLSGKPVWTDISDEPMEKKLIDNRNKFVLGGSGGGKSFFMNLLYWWYWLQGSHIFAIDVGNSYKRLCQYINELTNGEDGIYYAYTQEKPITFNPFYLGKDKHGNDNTLGLDKMESLQALILTLWKKNNEEFQRSEEVTVENMLHYYYNYHLPKSKVTPKFDTFYKYVTGGDFAKDYKEKEHIEITKELFNFNTFSYNLRQFYKGGTYDYLLNSEKELDLFHKRFVVFELDAIKDHPIIFPVVTLIMMETFTSKMMKLGGIRKVIGLDEAWVAVAKAGMAQYVKFLFKTCRKHYGEAIVISQEVDDIAGNAIIKDAILNNVDCQIFLDIKKFMNRFDDIAIACGLNKKQKTQILSINTANRSNANYKEVCISLKGKPKVYGTELSLEEYLIYTTEDKEKTFLTNIETQNNWTLTETLVFVCSLLRKKGWKLSKAIELTTDLQKEKGWNTGRSIKELQAA